MHKNSKIYIAGHNGLVGSALKRRLDSLGYSNLLVVNRDQLDLQDFCAVKEFLSTHKPEYIFLAAAKVGGILANNDYPAEFIYQNLLIQNNVIHSAYLAGVRKLLFLGSSCIYPRDCCQPIKEEYLLSGPLEKTNEAYAIAKIAGIKMCQAYNKQYGTNYISVMPTNLYGPNDNFDLNSSHVLPALIRKFHEAKTNGDEVVKIWGSGSPKREFLYVDDLADACCYLMENYKGNEILNVGTGEDLSIQDLAVMIKDVIGFKGGLIYENSKPDGTPRKLLDVTRLHKIGWHHKIALKDGIALTYQWFLKNYTA